MPDLHTGDRVRINLHRAPNWSPNSLADGSLGTIAERIGHVGNTDLWGVQIDGYTIVGIYAADELTVIESTVRAQLTEATHA